MVSSAGTASASTAPAPYQNGSPEHSTTTRWPRCANSFGIDAANGVSHSKVGLPSEAANARCLRPPAINSACASRSRAAADSPSSPSSPIPMMDSQGAGMSSLAVMTSSTAHRLRVLILGGTADANRLVAAVAEATAHRCGAVVCRPHRESDATADCLACRRLWRHRWAGELSSHREDRARRRRHPSIRRADERARGRRLRER